MKTLIVLPSYNESRNIIQLIDDILKRDPSHFVCVVDDSSPDGTAELVSEAIRKNPAWGDRTLLMVRSRKNGRGGAVRDGFAWGYRSHHNFEAFVEMDCDFSHEPKAIRTGLNQLKDGADVSLGVRYPDGVIIDWPVSRRIFSFFANTLTKIFITPSIPDYTNGFRFYTRNAVATLLSTPQVHKGYIYLSESLSLLLKAGLRINTFPTVFKNRKRGVSNTTFREISDAFKGIFSIAWKHRFKK